MLTCTAVGQVVAECIKAQMSGIAFCMSRENASCADAVPGWGQVTRNCNKLSSCCRTLPWVWCLCHLLEHHISVHPTLGWQLEAYCVSHDLSCHNHQLHCLSASRQNLKLLHHRQVPSQMLSLYASRKQHLLLIGADVRARLLLPSWQRITAPGGHHHHQGCVILLMLAGLAENFLLDGMLMA